MLPIFVSPSDRCKKIENNWDWIAEQDKVPELINNCIKHVTEVTHFKWNAELRKICDARRAGLGTNLQQQEMSPEWKPIHFALTTFLTEL